MIMAPSLNLIFVHIPKTAGSSVSFALVPHLDLEQDAFITNSIHAVGDPEKFTNADGIFLSEHATVGRCKRTLGPDKYRAMISVAFVRNPFARAWSSFSYSMLQASNPGPDAMAETVATYRRYCGDGFDAALRNIDETAQHIPMFRPQTTWLPKPQMVTILGRVETLQKDLDRVMTQLDLPVTKSPTENTSSAPGAWRGMSAYAADAIRDYYKSDFDTFGYDTETATAFPAGGQS
ncbi:sulfotransferase family 2 domain-containing protein [uncultured Tateyamaria sp.]|uniref:sulfotransferase family 2 domain-containing protein n=1 Tax=uncultured Tateyamaria sp. TaxID=455651 RepID=UPI00261508EA|nr:sulfotransferase family 2 domain-containing protein [uncultured Tateyamaria sp.]